MQYMPDTNICIYLIKHNPAKVLKHIKSHFAGDTGISSITLAELRYGVSKSRHVEKNRQALDEFTCLLKSPTSMKKRLGNTDPSGPIWKRLGSPEAPWIC